MRRRLTNGCGLLLVIATVCSGCAGQGAWSLPWSREPSYASNDVTKFEHPAGSKEKASPMQTLAAALTFGKSASKANSVAAKKASSIEASDPLSLQNMPKRIGPDVYVHAARLYEIQNNMPLATGNYERALEVDSENEAALIGLARLHDRQGKFDKATELYQRALKAHPENAQIHNDLAICLNRQGQVQSSLQSMQRAIQIEPREALYRNNIAKMLVQAGRGEEALQQLSAVLPPPAAHYNLGYLFYENQRPDLAKQYFAKALELQPGFAEAGKMIQIVQSVAASPPVTPAARPHLATPISKGPALAQPLNQQPPRDAGLVSRFAPLPSLPRQQSPVRQPYADDLDNTPALAPPVVEMPR